VPYTRRDGKRYHYLVLFTREEDSETDYEVVKSRLIELGDVWEIERTVYKLETVHGIREVSNSLVSVIEGTTADKLYVARLRTFINKEGELASYRIKRNMPERKLLPESNNK